VELLIKVLENEFTLSASSNTTVNTAVVVRLVHTGTQEHIITIGDGAGSNIGTFTMVNNSELILEKHRTDTLQVDSGTDVKVVSIAYKN
jgi:hypothetical protein